MNCATSYNDWSPMGNLIPVCASVVCQAPGVLYVRFDPDVFKIHCRQCQEKTEHRCPLPKLKRKFRGSRGPRPEIEFRKLNFGSDEEDEELEEVEEEQEEEQPEEKIEEKKEEEKVEPVKIQKPVAIPPEPVAIPDHYCTCTGTPKEICDCEVYKPLNFTFELEVTGEFKPAYVPKAKKEKYQ